MTRRTCVFVLMLLLSPLLMIVGQIDSSEVLAQQQGGVSTTSTAGNNCISYDSVKRMITVSCNSATLTDIYNQLNNPTVLNREPQERNGVWTAKCKHYNKQRSHSDY